ncbi:M48 family metallopeptidase [Hyalangium gracile]|uniref:M48 family metallopeptidase n=1 Tax=Hyalangium gracile TaxID=394092 RepID=UPI001CC9E38D|nr:M48 family metallopeptidase [Hyalangium gracile]
MVSTRSERSERSPWRLGAGALLAGLLSACQATDKPAFIARAEEKIEVQRRKLNRTLAERTEWLGSMSSVLSGCDLERRKAYELGPEQEDALGRGVTQRQLAALGAEPLPASDPVARYVEQVGQYLALVAEAVGNGNGPDRARRPERYLDNRPWPLAGYQFVVMPSEEPRAVGNPGGVVMISTGFLRSLESEEELAAVLAHEVAHVQRGHGVEVLKAFMCDHASRKESSPALTAFGQGSPPQEGSASGAPPSGSETGGTESLLGGAGLEAANLYREGFPRDFELEADRISVRILQAAGYDARALPALLQRMAREVPAKHAWLRMHPPPVERLEIIGERLEALGAARSWPSAEAVSARTRRFLEAMASVKASPEVRASHGAQSP